MPRNATTTANGPFGSPSGNNKNSLNTKLAKGFLIILLWLGSLMATMFLAKFGHPFFFVLQFDLCEYVNIAECKK